MPLDASANHLRYLILAIQAEGERRLNAALQDAGSDLTATQSEVLEVLHAGGPMSQSELGEHLVCTKGNISRLLDRMEAKALLRREADPDTRRRVRVVLTEEGRRAFATAEGSIGAVLATLRSLYTESEMQRLVELLTRITGAFGIEVSDHVARTEERHGIHDRG